MRKERKQGRMEGRKKGRRNIYRPIVFKGSTYLSCRSGQAITHTIPCPMDHANQDPSGEKSTLHVSQPARPSSDGGWADFNSNISPSEAVRSEKLE
jgi:hypothetical protein